MIHNDETRTRFLNRKTPWKEIISPPPRVVRRARPMAHLSDLPRRRGYRSRSGLAVALSGESTDQWVYYVHDDGRFFRL